MQKLSTLMIATVLLIASMATVAAADTKVTLKGMHLCCGACLRGVSQAVEDIQGVSVAMNRKEGITVISAPDEKTAQVAVDAIAAAGFHGQSDSKKITMKSDSGVEGKVERLELYGAHNCCGGCTKAIAGALKSVEGIQGSEITGKKAKLVIEGNFDAGDVVKALYEAGFHVTAKKPSKE